MRVLVRRERSQSPAKRPQQDGDDRRQRAEQPFRIEIGLIDVPGQELGVDIAGQIAVLGQNTRSEPRNGHEGEKRPIPEQKQDR